MVGDGPLILVLYVDDLFISGGDGLITSYNEDLASEFEMEIEQMHYFLGFEVWKEDGHIILGKGKYVTDILRRFHMVGCKPMTTNWKKLSTSESELVDATLHHQSIGSLMGDGFRLVGYTDLDWAGCATDRKSTLGCCFGLGLTVVCWFSQKEKVVALNIVEAEYIAAS
ncbi:uncharacterized mitochondrial protein AtMg00810-like [Cryptomeria japonica]|uniref:uncharacterized mitochondrial protein AtMg00810-like n=1 Tax=Cryptomeria japonica TaxID=3369 RepID=UPI0027DA3A61|nr:uncharacterized mitochondrial protein AtMg00810-like [Cryptomeria japonica]